MTFFRKTTLADLGLQLRLEHSNNYCPRPVAAHPMFMVFDTSDIHVINLSFCGCLTTPHQDIQPMHVGWYPSTTVWPQTVFTFNHLGTFHKLTLQSKVTVFNVYHTLVCLTDNASLGKMFVSSDSSELFLVEFLMLFPQYSYKDFSRVLREWHNLTALKQAGRAHNSSGIDATPPGGLAVECTTCPHSDVNLPDNWKLATPANQFFYVLYISIDAKFKLGSETH